MLTAIGGCRFEVGEGTTILTGRVPIDTSARTVEVDYGELDALCSTFAAKELNVDRVYAEGGGKEKHEREKVEEEKHCCCGCLPPNSSPFIPKQSILPAWFRRNPGAAKNAFESYELWMLVGEISDQEFTPNEESSIARKTR